MELLKKEGTNQELDWLTEPTEAYKYQDGCNCKEGIQVCFCILCYTPLSLSTHAVSVSRMER